MLSRKTKKWMKGIGAVAVARRFPLLGIAAAAAGGAYAYYKLRGRRGGMSSDEDMYAETH